MYNRISLDMQVEKQYWNLGYKMVLGVDEVGRGCLAGPVVAAAVVFPIGHLPIPGVNDSKQLSSKKRESLDILIRTQALAMGIGEVGAAIIDEIGIVEATALAMRRAAENIKPDVILVDGPSKLGLEGICPRVEAIVKGDQKIYSIAAASNVAKVYRDNLMSRLAESYPIYFWQCNKGYGTRAHVEAIEKYGMTGLHRKSFVVKHIQ